MLMALHKLGAACNCIMCGTMEGATFAIYVCLCVTGFVPMTSGTTLESQYLTTTPPVGSVPPLRLEAGNEVNIICSTFDQEKCGTLYLHSCAFDVLCSEGYSPNLFNGSSLYTLYVNETWTPRLPECKKRWCEPLKSLNVDFRCQYGGLDIDCNQTVPDGTEATGRCKAGYLPTEKASDASIVCTENGQWSGDLVDCVASACGMYIRNSTESVDPWLVAIYRDDSLSCFGTLISPHIVLAAPYCVTESSGSTVISPHRVVVTVGKYLQSQLRDQLRGETVQVRQISIPSQYFGIDTNYAFGIALIDLETSVSSVPVCLDWEQEFHTTPGQRGTVAGWDASGILHYIQGDYVDYVSCVSYLRPNYHNLVTPDKFCLKLINRPQGELKIRGSGYYFELNGVYYVKGVTNFWWGNIVVTITSLSDMDLLYWIHQTTLSFTAFHDGT